MDLAFFSNLTFLFFSALKDIWAEKLSLFWACPDFHGKAAEPLSCVWESEETQRWKGNLESTKGSCWIAPAFWEHFSSKRTFRHWDLRVKMISSHQPMHPYLTYLSELNKTLKEYERGNQAGCCIWAILGKQHAKLELLSDCRLNCMYLFIGLRSGIRSVTPGTASLRVRHLSCHQHCHTQHHALPSQISMRPALPMRGHGELMWILDTDPITCLSSLFSVPLQFQSPGFISGETWGCVSSSGAASHTDTFLCYGSHTGKGWDERISEARWDTDSQPGLCLGLTPGSPQCVEMVVVFPVHQN